MNPYSVSVVVPAYNAAGTIARAIDSVLTQSYPAEEIIVVDDGSQPPLGPVLKPYGERVNVIRQSNAHAAAARNRGIAAAKSNWIAFLDADDYWEPDKLRQQVAILQRFPKVDVVSGRYYTQNPGAERSLPAFRLNHLLDRPWDKHGSAAFTLGTLMWTSTVVVRRSLLQSESFVSGLEPAEDRDLWVRLAKRGTVYLASRPVATAVLESTGISRAGISHDCSQMQRVISRHQSMLGWRATRYWRSYVTYRWAINDRNARSSFLRLLKSFCWWPLPYPRHVNIRPLGRLRRLCGLMRSNVTRRPRKPIAPPAIANRLNAASDGSVER